MVHFKYDSNTLMVNKDNIQKLIYEINDITGFRNPKLIYNEDNLTLRYPDFDIRLYNYNVRIVCKRKYKHVKAIKNTIERIYGCELNECNGC